MNTKPETSNSVPITPRNFDKEAATWDDNPHRRALTQAIAQAIRASIPLDPSWHAMEYGCGTASLSLLLASSLGRITAADASQGMIEQVHRKLAQLPVSNLHPQLLDLAKDSTLAQRFNLIMTAMVLHHVPDTRDLLAKLGRMLTPGGYLAIVDLCTEDGSFHAPERVPHNGFDCSVLATLFQDLFPNTEVQCHVIHRVEKPSGSFDVFLLTAQLP